MRGRRLVGAGAGLFLLGHLSNNDQQRETGILSGRGRRWRISGYGSVQIRGRARAPFCRH